MLDHGISQEFMDEVFAESKNYFALPNSEKMKLLQDLVPGCNKVTFFFVEQELLSDQLVLRALPMFLLTDYCQGRQA